MGNAQGSEKKNFGSIYPTDNSKPRPGYYFRKNKIVYQGKVLELLPNEESFQKLKYSYVKTNQRVFYKGEPIHGANPKTFISINRNNIKQFSNKKSLEKLNSVIGMDIIDNTKRFYYHGNIIHTE
jgi:hypothetical protein